MTVLVWLPVRFVILAPLFAVSWVGRKADSAAWWLSTRIPDGRKS